MPTRDDASPARRICLCCQQEYPFEEKRCPKDGTVLVAVSVDPYIGKTINERYSIETPLGTGGTSVVYKARHLQLERPVAIKMLKAHLLSEEESKRRFEQEARAVSCLTHPHVVNVYDVGVTGYGEPYIVMEYLEGTSLSEVVEKEGALNQQRAVRIFSQACAALSHAHKKEVIHRDVKPSNIMLVPTDEDPEFVKIVDFGLAKLRTLTGEFRRLTKTGDIFGSPVYMSPEQCTGKPLDQRTDVYSMGVVMYEALTGTPPFKAKSPIETIRQHLKEPAISLREAAPDAGITEELENIVLKALAKSPDERYQSMDELRSALHYVSGGIASLPTPPQMEALVLRDKILGNPLAEQPKPQKSNVALFVYLTIAVVIAVIVFLFVQRR